VRSIEDEVLRVEPAHEFVPQEPRGPQHGDVHEEVHAMPKKKDSRGANWSMPSPLERGLHIFQSVGQGEGTAARAGAGFHHV